MQTYICRALSAWTREGSLSVPTLPRFLRVCLRDVGFLHLDLGIFRETPTITKLQKGRCNNNNTLYVHKNACIKMFINQNYKWLNDQDLQSPPPPPIWMKYNINLSIIITETCLIKQKQKCLQLALLLKTSTKLDSPLEGPLCHGTINILTSSKSIDAKHVKTWILQPLMVMVTSPLFDGNTRNIPPVTMARYS